MAGLGERFAFAYDYSQLYLYDAAREWSSDGNTYLDALDAATESGLTVGAHSDVVDVLMPRQENFGSAIEVTLTATAPPIRDGADHIVEFDLLLPSGRLVLEGSGGSGKDEVTTGPGSYRARLTGYEFDAAVAWSYGDPGNPGDRYLLELWPTSVEEAPLERRRWPGYPDER